MDAFTGFSLGVSVAMTFVFVWLVPRAARQHHGSSLPLPPPNPGPPMLPPAPEKAPVPKKGLAKRRAGARP